MQKNNNSAWKGHKTNICISVKIKPKFYILNSEQDKKITFCQDAACLQTNILGKFQTSAK